MTVQAFIDKIEEDYLEDDLESLSAKDRIGVYLNAKEFIQAKLQRASAAPLSLTGNNFTVEHVVTQDADTDD